MQMDEKQNGAFSFITDRELVISLDGQWRFQVTIIAGLRQHGMIPAGHCCALTNSASDSVIA